MMIIYIGLNIFKILGYNVIYLICGELVYRSCMSLDLGVLVLEFRY